MKGQTPALIFLGLLIIAHESEAFSPPSSETPPPLSATSPIDGSSPQENIKVQTYEIEIGKILTLPSRNPTRSLMANPEVAVVVLKPQGVEIKAQKVGSTLLIWWEELGIRSAQIVVTRPVQEIQRIEEIKLQSTKLYQSHQERSFKFSYDSEYSILDQEKALPHVSEVQKIYNHQTQLEGSTPLGKLKGSLFYEYRKDQILEKSVALPRDMWFGLFGTDFPWSRLLDDYDMSVGRQYLKLSDFGFPGSRYTGFTMVPSLQRTVHPEKGRYDISFFVGRERSGALLDNPAGTNRRDIKLKNRFTGEKIDFYLWKDGRVSLGSYQKWGGPTLSTQSKKNFDMEFDWRFPYLRFKGETGLDSRTNVAMHFASIVENSWLFLENGFLRVNPHYNTVTGTTLDKGRRGYQLRSHFFPLKALGGSDAIRLAVDGDITRDLLSLNQKRPESFNQQWGSAFNWRLPYHLRSDFSFGYENKKAISFPFTRKTIRERFGKEFSFDSKWIKRSRLYGIAAYERYGDAEATPGFNSNRYELGGGAYVTLFGGLWISSQYLWDRLDEKEPNLDDPDGRIYPGQLILSGGISRSFRRLPLNVNLSVRYTDERKSKPKLHLPFSNEDRFEVRGALNWKLPYDSVFFVETSATTAEPLAGGPEKAELSVDFGVHVKGDTHFYLPQKGTIEGYFFIDKNANGVFDPDEVGLSGYEVSIEHGPKTKTNQRGYYRLHIKEGMLNLKATQQIPEGYFFTTINSQQIEMLPKDKTRVDFGIVPQIQIKGRAYLDLNGNLIFDEGDISMPAIQIVLDSGQFAVTSADGLYSILRVHPGPNRVRVIINSIPSGYKTLTPIEHPFEGAAGDLLNFDVIMAAQRIVSGYVFEDENGNGRYDIGEKGIAGIEIDVGNKKVTTTKDGKYTLADLAPGLQKIILETRSLPPEEEAKTFEKEVDVAPGFFEKNDVHFPLRHKDENRTR